MPCAGWNENGVARADLPLCAVDFHEARAFEDEIEFLGDPVKVSLGGIPCGDPGLGETLVLHRCIGAIENAADGGAVLGGKRRLLIEVLDKHGGVWEHAVRRFEMKGRDRSGTPGAQSPLDSALSADNTPAQMTLFKGCTALITGASSGIGAEFARQLAPHAQCLVLVARRGDRLDQLRDRCARPGLRIYCVSGDLGDPVGRHDVIGKIRATGEQITFLVNNAGVGDHGLFEESDWGRVEAMLEVNIAALTRLTHEFVPDLVRSGRGAVLNVSSIASLLPVPTMAVYAATKAYVTSFTEALRSELRGTGVSVTALCPGPVPTEFFEIAERGGPDNPRMRTPEFLKVSAGQVTREALEAVGRDRARVIPGVWVWGLMAVAALVPMALLRVFLQRGSKGVRSGRSFF